MKMKKWLQKRKVFELRNLTETEVMGCSMRVVFSSIWLYLQNVWTFVFELQLV